MSMARHGSFWKTKIRQLTRIIVAKTVVAPTPRNIPIQLNKRQVHRLKPDASTNTSYPSQLVYISMENCLCIGIIRYYDDQQLKC
jgi:hypothetical protein